MNNVPIIYVDGYARISTDETRQRYSLPVQEKRIREYVQSRCKEGYRLFKIHFDQQSGTNLNRPGLQALLDDAQKGRISRVLIVKLDRLCRNLRDQLYLFDLFETWGIKLEGTDEDIDLKTPDGVTFAQVRGAFNESESQKNSYRTKKAMREKAAQGGWCGGIPPLGYLDDKLAKSLVPDPDRTPILKEIFYLYTHKKLGAKSIAVGLNNKGLRTRNGMLFSTSGIISIITNPCYVGNVRWDGEVFPGKHQPLIDLGTFKRTQAILAERRGDPSLRRSNSSEYPLSGLLYCERCGRRLVGVSAHGRSRIYRYYSCPGKFKYGECNLENLSKERIDVAVFSQLKQIFANTPLINRILDRVKVKRTSKVCKKKGELKLLERQISHKLNLVRRYLSAFESGALEATETLNERVTEIEQEIRLLKERKVHLTEETERSRIQPLSAEDLRRVVDKLEEVIMGAGASERRAFVRNIVKRIKVRSASHIEPYYRIPSVRIISALAPRAGRLRQPIPA